MKKYINPLRIWLCLCCLVSLAHAQVIQINTQLYSFVGKPSWLLVIRDLDHGQTIPYVFDIRKGSNFWIAMTYGHNYLITASTLQFSPYKQDPYNTKHISNFCHLESHGRVIKGDSFFVTVSGNLTPRINTFNCTVSQFPDNRSTIAPQETSVEN